MDVANSYAVSKLPFNNFSQNGGESFFGNDTTNKGIVIKKNSIVRIEFFFHVKEVVEMLLDIAMKLLKIM